MARREQVVTGGGAPRCPTPRRHVGLPPGQALDFATGWDDGTQSHGQPADVTSGPDGRMYVANDWNGDIVWVAPIQ